MAGALNKDHESYEHFNAGFKSRHAPLSAIDKKMLNFAVKLSRQPAAKAHGQILNHFGMYPPEFWTRSQRLSDHPDIAPKDKETLSYIFPDPSRPGPMEGGAPVNTEGKSFSHGLEW